MRETVEGIIVTYGEQLKSDNGDYHVAPSNEKTPAGKVGVVAGGGSGHLSVFLGHVGKGVLNGCTVGNVFTSPFIGEMENTVRVCDLGDEVLCLYGSYGGDDMNFHMACGSVKVDDVKTRTIKVRDDTANSPKGEESRRRGIVGVAYVFKVAGAVAEQMRSFCEVEAVTKKAFGSIRSMRAALLPYIVPQVGKPTSMMGNGEVETGMGIHGEAGIRVRKMMTADKSPPCLPGKILEDMELVRGDKVFIMVSNLGVTPLEEQMIAYRSIHQELIDMGVGVVALRIGEFATSMGMAGVPLTVFKLDGELKELFLRPVMIPFYRI